MYELQRKMTGVTMPRGLGIFAALAVSGTALYLAYGYKKKPFQNIRRGKGSLRLEYHPVHPSEESGTSVGQSEGKEVDAVEVHCQHLPCQRRSRRQQPLLLLPAPSSTREQEEMREKLLQCEADAALVKSLHTTLTSYKVGHLAEQLERGSEASLDKFTDGVAGPDIISAESSSFASARDSLVSSSSSYSVGGDCSSEALSDAAAPSRYAIVGCRVSSGSESNGNKAEKQKKVVRFSPSVAEPSSNNHDYRRRCKAQIAQRAASSRQRIPEPSSDAAIRSIVFERPRLYSQAAKQTITYNIHRGDHRYGGRAYYSPAH